MAAAYSVMTRILGEDRLSEVFRKVSGAAKSAWSPVKAFNQAVGEPKTTALGKVGSVVDQVAGKFRSGLSSISAWLPALGAIGAAGSLAGLISMTRHAAEGYEGLTLASQKLGVSTKDLAVWRFGAKLAGVEAEQLEKGLVKANKAMYDAATGKNKDVAALFAAMKIPLRDANGQMKNVGNSLEDIAEAFKNTEDPAMRDAAAIALFGRAGAELLPFLMKGRAGITELREEMRKYSGLTDTHRQDLGHLAESYKRLDKAGSGLSSRFSAALAPSLAKVVDWTTEWIAANRELMAQSLERKLGSIERGLTKVAEIGREIADWPVVKEFFAGVDASHAFDIGLALLGVTMAGPVFAALQAVTGAVIAMNRAFLANPVVAVGALIVGVAVELVKHWDEVKQAFKEAWDQFGVFGVAFQLVNVPINLLFAALNDLTKALFGIDLDKWGEWFTSTFNAVIEGALNKLREWMAVFQRLWAPIQKGIDFVGQTFTGRNKFGGATFGGETYGGNTFGGARFGASAVPPPPAPDSPAARAAQGPPQQVKVMLSGEIKAPPGSQLTAKVEGAGRGSGADVGLYMADDH